MARATFSGCSALKIPLPTNTDSAPSWRMRAASAGGAPPPAGKVGAGGPAPRGRGLPTAPLRVLNQNYEALTVCDIRRAFRLLGSEKAELIARNHQVIHTPTRAYAAPPATRPAYLV